jgi:hypothetical protein
VKLANWIVALVVNVNACAAKMFPEYAPHVELNKQFPMSWGL